MADVTIYGFAFSTYVRTARMACAEKGITHDLEPIEPGAPSHLKLHPFGKMPAFKHGDFLLYETSAIGAYVDEAFDGPALQPADVKERARMRQWLSVTSDYCYQSIIRGLVIPRFVHPTRGIPVDENAIKAALPKIEGHVGILDGALEGREYLVGQALTLADLMLFPIVFYLSQTPEGGPMLSKAGNLKAWYERMNARPSAAATLPPPPAKAAE
jgi:glutathione S-transferase